jgi:ABC-type uncharacterized transport system permease subunit
VSNTLYLALTCYAAGTLIAFTSLFTRAKWIQTAALAAMGIGLVPHTVFIGTICAKTGHPPLTNLPESAAFISWTILVIAMFFYVRYRVMAASFFLYPVIFLLLLLTALVGEPFAMIDPALRSRVFTAHVFLSALGVAWLFIGLAFTTLAYLQDRALVSKARGRLWELIPSLSICKRLGNGALSIGFVVYTIGLLSGIAWAFRGTGSLGGAKQLGAIVAWILFALLLQARMAGVFRERKLVFVSAGAFVATIVSILGIAHG